MAEISRPELCIVGAGALGIALAQHARRLGANVLLADRGQPEPGDGPQRALRLAALAASAAAARAMRHGARLGLTNAEPKPGLKAVQERARKVAADRAALDSHERLAALGIEVVTGPVRFTDPATLMIGAMPIKPQALILALGNVPVIPTIAGLDEVDYFTTDSIFEAHRKLSHLLVIGSDAEGLALAQIFVRLGSAVTLVPQGPLLAGHDAETRAILLQGLAGEGVHIIDGGVVRAIQPRAQGTGALVDLPDGGTLALDVSHLLVADGGMADFAALGLDAARLRPLRGRAGQFAIGPLGQTSNRRVRVVGSAAGNEQWQHGLSHGRAVVESLVLGAPRRRPMAQPLLVMTEPQLAQVGRVPGKPGKLPQGHGLYRRSFAGNDKALALGRDRGLVKVLTDAKGHIVGASLVGPDAAELAGLLALAMERGLPLDSLADLSLPHPSLMMILAELGRNRLEGQSVSSWTRRRAALRRLLPF